MATVEIAQGSVATGYEPVRDAFEKNFREREDVGAGFSAYVGGKKVVDLWGGEARPGRPWQEDTMALSFSVGKGIVAFVAQLLADRGQLEIDAPVVQYWPEFAQNGKEAVTVRQVLTHTAGLPSWPEYWNVVSLDRPASYLDLEAITGALAAAPLQWEPGSRFGYHSTTYGWLTGEIVRRITGKTLGRYFHDEVAVPLGLDMYVGVPESELDRIALLVPDPSSDSDEVYDMINYRSSIGQVAFIGPEKRFGAAIRDTYNSPEMWRAENPAANPVGDARSLARFYALLANGGELDGVRLVSSESIDRHTEVIVDTQDTLWGTHFRVGLGYMRSCGWYQMGPNDAFGHAGLGGAVGWADADRNVSFGYVMNRLVLALETDARVVALYDALYGCLEA
jgi:CubicO group peptidase (beta-lactamase class C family)